jgi:hypothetical protein
MTTTTNAQGINFRQTHFQHADLTPIKGEPKNGTLKVLINELKANAQTIHSNLGGGANGHLGLVLTPQKYNLIAPGTPYIRPPFPGALLIPPGTTNIQAQMMKEAHEQALREFHETETVHNALVQQVVKAIEPMYLKALRNPLTQAFTVPLNEILQHLMTVYGKLNPKTFKSMKDEVESYQYDISLPVDVVFDPIDDLAELAGVADQPMTEAQMINIAFIVFQNTGKFKSDLKAWNRKNEADKTWSNMKKHFRDALEDIRDVDDVTIEQTFDQANMVREVLDGVRAIVRDQVAEAIPNYFPAYMNNAPPPPAPQFQNPERLPNPAANMVTGQPMYMANAVMPMAQAPRAPPLTAPQPQFQPTAPPPQYANMQQPGFSNFGTRGRRRARRGRGGRNGRQSQQMTASAPYPQMPYQSQPFPVHMQATHQMYNPAQAPTQGPSRRNVTNYCWSHGACAHNGFQCFAPLPGHIPHATMHNRMGGCNDFCP